MVCQRDCFNCGSEDDVRWKEELKEYYCDSCFEIYMEDKK